MNEDVTRMINAIEDGDSHASEELLPLVYEELRRLAAQRMANERADHTLQPTALVHEAYLKLVNPGQTPAHWDCRAHFFGAAAEAMRRILVDSARRKQRIKHGGHLVKVELKENDALDTGNPDYVVAVDEAIQRLRSEEMKRFS